MSGESFLERVKNLKAAYARCGPHPPEGMWLAWPDVLEVVAILEKSSPPDRSLLRCRVCGTHATHNVHLCEGDEVIGHVCDIHSDTAETHEYARKFR